MYEHNKNADRPGELASRILAALDCIPPCSSILDVGCGKGIIASLVTTINPSITYHGCDISAEAIDFCKKNIGKKTVGKHDANVAFSVGDVEGDWKTPAKQYDVVLCLEVLEHVKDKGAVLRRLVGKLKPGGTLVLTTPNASSLYVRLKSVKDGIFGRGRYDKPLRFDELATLAAATGTVKKHEAFYKNVYQLLVVQRPSGARRAQS